MTDKQVAVLVSLLRGETKYTRSNAVIAPLCRANLVTITEYRGMSAKTLELTAMGRIVAQKHTQEAPNGP